MEVLIAWKAMVAWMLTLLVSVTSLEAPSYLPETPVEREDRYRDIISDVLSVAYDPSEAPLFKGDQGRAKTATLLLAISSFESGFRKDVDTGVGEHARGDHGRSWCLMQINLGAPNKEGKSPTRIELTDDYYKWSYTPGTGYGGEDLVQDRKLCFKAGLHMVRQSFRSCSSGPVEDRLRLYASGSCDKGRQASFNRMHRMLKWFKSYKDPADDTAVFASMQM